MNKKNNKQFQNSDLRMKQAMLELMNVSPFEKITVRSLCEKAKVNRSTFYAHYKDIFDMIEQMEFNLQNELLNDYSAFGTICPFSVESFTIFLKFIRTHQYFYRVALRVRPESLLKRGFNQLWNQTLKPLYLDTGLISESEMKFYFVGFQAGFIMILKRWVEGNCTESEEQIAQIVQNIIPSVWKNK